MQSRVRLRMALLLGLVSSTLVLVYLATSVGAATNAGSASQAGSTLVMDRATDIFGFDPVTQGDGTSIYTDLSVYDQLVELAPDGKTLLPGLATKWQVAKNGLSILFTLRSGVKFSDGSLLKPSDVVFSLQRSTNPKSSYGALFGGAVKSVAQVGSNQVKVTLSKPFAPLLASLSLWLGSIYSQANWTKWGKAASQHPLGTGPYMLKKWVKGSEVDLVANPYYWGSPKPSIQNIVFKNVGDQAARALALESGAAQMIDVVPPNQVSAIENSGAKIASVVGASVLPVDLNLNKVPAFKDQNVRLALAWSLDRDAMAKAAYFGLAKPALSDLPAHTFFYDPKGAIGYDMTKAAAYLKASAFPSGFSFTLNVPSGGSAEATVAQIWQQALTKLGIHMTINTLDATTAYAQWGGETYQAALTPLWVNDTPDAFEFAQYTITATKPTGISGFHTGYVNAQGRAYAEQAQSATSKSVRQQLYSKIQNIYNTTAFIPYIVDPPVLYGVSSKVHGFTPNQAGNGNYYFNHVTLSS